MRVSVRLCVSKCVFARDHVRACVREIECVAVRTTTIGFFVRFDYGNKVTLRAFPLFFDLVLVSDDANVVLAVVVLHCVTAVVVVVIIVASSSSLLSSSSSLLLSSMEAIYHKERAKKINGS